MEKESREMKKETREMKKESCGMKKVLRSKLLLAERKPTEL